MNSPLRAARLGRKLTLAATSRALDMDESTLSRIERTGRASQDKAEVLAKHFDLTLEQVLFPNGNERKVGANQPAQATQCD